MNEGDFSPSENNPFRIGDYVRMQPIGCVRWYYGCVDAISGDGVRMVTARYESVTAPCWYVEKAKRREAGR